MDNRFKAILEHRRSIRKYTGETIPDEVLDMVVRTGLMSPRGRNLDTVELIVIKDKSMLNLLSECRPVGPGMLANADAAIAVIGRSDLSGVWTEDCAAAMTAMHIMADSLELGSCWVQIRGRESKVESRTAEDVCRDALGFPEEYRLEAILSLGVPADRPEGKHFDDVDTNKIHYEKY